MSIRIGTRASKLALWQAHHIQDLLESGGLKAEIIPIQTKGDKILDVSLSKIGSKGVFTQELEDALRNNEIDIAVHSAKDLQSHLPSDLEIIAFGQREDASDVLVSYQTDIRLDNHTNLVIGSSSTRRQAIIRRHYEKIQLVEMRGNLQTRLAKLSEGHCDALILAGAGMMRMGYQAQICQVLPQHIFCPPVGQGSIAVQASIALNPEIKNRIVDLTNHLPTAICLQAERAFLYTMQGGCSIPVFGHATHAPNGQISLHGGIISLDGQQIVEYEMFDDPSRYQKLGEQLAHKVLQNGGEQILNQIRAQRL